MTETEKLKRQYNLSLLKKLSTQFKEIANTIYPVGSVYISTNSTSPALLFGGSWEAIQSRFLVGASVEYGAGSYGGAKYHSHTLSSAGYAEISAYKSNSRIGQGIVAKSWTADQYITVSAAPVTASVTMANATPLGGATDINWDTLPPYLSVYMWKRVL